MFEVNHENTITMSYVVLVFLQGTFKKFTSFNSISIDDFEQINFTWIVI